MARKVTIDAAKCKGCGYCVSSCPKHALTLSGEFNAAGYNFAVVNAAECIGCGTCYTVCPDYVYTVVEE